eukprot:4262550-Amphidinium_carterae.1
MYKEAKIEFCQQRHGALDETTLGCGEVLLLIRAVQLAADPSSMAEGEVFGQNAIAKVVLIGPGVDQLVLGSW